MRLKRLRSGHRWPQKLLMAAIRLRFRIRIPDVLRTLLYRPELYGQAYNRWLQAAARGPSPWSVGERELIAAFTSHLNHCHF
jgi:hypothetical protein